LRRRAIEVQPSADLSKDALAKIVSDDEEAFRLRRPNDSGGADCLTEVKASLKLIVEPLTTSTIP
jgi:hypothetical protein